MKIKDDRQSRKEIKELACIPKIRLLYCIYHTSTKIPFMYFFLLIARPHSQFPHSCVCERFIYSQVLSKYIWLQQRRQTDPGNNKSLTYIWVLWVKELGDRTLSLCFGNKEDTQFHFWEYINGNQKFILYSNRPFICSVHSKNGILSVRLTWHCRGGGGGRVKELSSWVLVYLGKAWARQWPG